MSDTKRETKFNQQWWQRKMSYAVIALAVTILGGLGIIPEDQIDPLVNQIGNVVAGALLFLATVKTKPGSDDPATTPQLQAATAQAQGVQAQVQSALAELPARVEQAIAGLPQQVQDAVRSVYDQPYGRHDEAAVEPEPDLSGPGIYPGGQ
ncbi:hypothetical protein [Corynebacterium glyciniphilum]|uniref:hypothetical protein n=1 Tax=Corynebacterium glyciniphilum TaxID=1404244 RepID=UPI003FD12E09